MDEPTEIPAPPTWPELEAIRALPSGIALLAPGITTAGFADALDARGTPVPAELLALLAATDGLVLRNRETDEVVLRFESSQTLAAAERDGRQVLLLASWWLRPFGHARETLELWFDDGLLSGAYERRHPSQPVTWVRFGARPFDVRAMLRFGLGRVEAQSEGEQDRELGVVSSLLAERSWGWYLADDDERVAIMVRAGRRAQALAYCRRMAEDLQGDAESSTRAGEHGEATRAERAAEAWLARARALA